MRAGGAEAKRDLWGHLTPVKLAEILFFSVFVSKITITFNQNLVFDSINLCLNFHMSRLICKKHFCYNIYIHLI